jgi:8-oxo-dGTP pyrophosphatase MutT (NUDIX family)
MIEAAGGVVWRETSSRDLEILLVHRPHRRDWSLPKGKRRRGESALECAVREVHEETGMRGIVGHELPESRYTDRKGRPKRVRYWSMDEPHGEFRPNDEVDEVRWVRLDRISDVLTYDRDALVVAGLQHVHFSVV